MTKQISSVSELPTCAAVYAMFGGRGRGRYVAYVGIATALSTQTHCLPVMTHVAFTQSMKAVGASAPFATHVFAHDVAANRVLASFCPSAISVATDALTPQCFRNRATAAHNSL
jgi:hypothetical protein